MKKIIVRVSEKYHVLIPKPFRVEMNIRPGQELLMYSYKGSLRLSLVRSITEIRGMAKGMSWRGEERDRKDRF